MAYDGPNPYPVIAGGTGAQTLTARGVLIGEGTAPVQATAAGTAGQVLQSGGAGANPSYSTATYPSTAGTSGNVITSNGTNFTSSAFPTRIQTINGDSGSVTGTTVTIFANRAGQASGATVGFTNSGTSSQLFLTDANDNVLIGRVAGNASLSGASSNIGMGAGALQQLINGNSNVGIGQTALNGMTNGVQNVGVGRSAHAANQTGNGTVAVGFECLVANTGIGANTGVGWRALNNSVGGAYNLAVGISAGTNYTGSESSNIMIANAGTLAESNVLRIGTQGSGNAQVNQAFIAGIVGVTNSNAQMVTINSSTGQLGVATGSGIFAWTDVTGASQALAVGNGYLTDNAGGVAYSLPASATIGQEIIIMGKLGLASVSQAAGQQICLGNTNTTAGVTGSITATNVGDCIHLRCITAGASTIWRAQDFVGNWTIV